MRSRPFWLLSNIVLLAFHIVATYTLFTNPDAFGLIWIKVWLIMFIAHVFELPIAFLATKERPASMVQTIFMTMLFGFTWWLPVRLGVFGRSPIKR
ncbi:MAG: hypothetical protein ACI9HX_000076 [Pseudoalteromonas tetraodonis]|jgi:hypothetical protein